MQITDRVSFGEKLDDDGEITLMVETFPGDFPGESNTWINKEQAIKIINYLTELFGIGEEVNKK